jgi:hypothetical protein
LRGDCGFGNEGVMREAEARGLPYLFKLRLTKNVLRMIEKLSGPEWVNAGQGFWAKESAVRLEGWSRQRRTIVLRQRLTGAVGLSHDDERGAPRSFRSSRSARRRRSTNTRFWSPRSMRRQKRSVSSIATAATGKTSSTR